MKEIMGKALNKGYARGEAVVFQVPFSFIGDMSPKTGEVTMVGHPNFGIPLKNKILVVTTGRGGTIAPYILYEAMKNQVAPAAILCDKADMLTLECALTVNIPILDGQGNAFTSLIQTGDMIEIKDDVCKVIL